MVMIKSDPGDGMAASRGPPGALTRDHVVTAMRRLEGWRPKLGRHFVPYLVMEGAPAGTGKVGNST